MATVEEIAKKLNKEFNSNNFITKADITPEYQKLATNALGFDYPLFGGIPYGRIMTFAGKEHSGKTTAAFLVIAAYQRENPDKICVFVDFEHSADLKHQIKMNGVDMSKLLYVNPDVQSGEDVLDTIIELQKGDNIGVIVIDSIPAIVPAKVMENDISKDMGMQGTIAKKLHVFTTQIAPMIANKNNILIFINQVRVSGKTFTGAPIYSEPGGDAPKYYSSVKIRFGTRTFTKEDDMDACKPDGDGADGFRLKYIITKNKTAPCNRGGGFITYRYATGLDWLHDLLEIAIQFDFIHRVNNVTYELVNLDTGEVMVDESGNQLRGKKKDLINYILTHIDFQNTYLDMINRYIKDDSKSYGELLDERSKAEIKEEANAVGDV